MYQKELLQHMNRDKKTLIEEREIEASVTESAQFYHKTTTIAEIGMMMVPAIRCKYCTEMDASLVGAPVFKTVCVALILSQVGSIPTHLRHFI